MMTPFFREASRLPDTAGPCVCGGRGAPPEPQLQMQLASETQQSLPPQAAPILAMESGPSLAFQPAKADLLLADLERRQCLPLDLALDSGDQTPGRLHAPVTFPRQDPARAHAGAAVPEGNDSGEEIVTYISENTTVTSADEEKLLLLNKNTELRRINQELMKLTQDWDDVYHTTTLELQHKLGLLQAEVSALKVQAQKLSAKLEHEQSKREYYEQALFQELKRSQAWQDGGRRLEGRHPPGRETQESRGLPPLPWEEATAPPWQRSAKGNAASQRVGAVLQRACSSEGPADQKQDWAGAERELRDLKVQLDALRCQTEIYKADYRMEQKDRQRLKAENVTLRRKEEEMRQQLALLQEQLKVFEDDFWKERSDKQVLQQLLKTKAPPLLHRGNGHEKAPAAATPALPRRGSCACHCHGKEHGPCRGKRN